jgi:hypothetical protein
MEVAQNERETTHSSVEKGMRNVIYIQVFVLK